MIAFLLWVLVGFSLLNSYVMLRIVVSHRALLRGGAHDAVARQLALGAAHER